MTVIAPMTHAVDVNLLVHGRFDAPSSHESAYQLRTALWLTLYRSNAGG